MSLTGSLPPDGEPTALVLDLPVFVSAGADRNILRGYPTSLQGLGTSHPLHRTFVVTWRQLEGEKVFLSNASSLCPTFRPPLAEQDLVFRLEASDGVFTTTDDVVLHVKADPHDRAPMVAAGPDRFLGYAEPAKPQPKDTAGELATDVTVAWEELVLARLDTAPAADPAVTTPWIFRLSATRNGLASAPDHLMLFPFDENSITNQSPTASLAVNGTALVEPGGNILLDASLSSDPNGERIRLRWEQLSDDASCLEPTSENTLTLTAPTRPQELVYRVFASDGVLESAPAEAKIVVSAGPDFLVPAVYPGPDRRTRPGRNVRLDALGGLPNGNQEQPIRTYHWSQTTGAQVALVTEGDGRVLSFAAPEVIDTLAFAVFGRLDGVDGDPRVATVTIVGEDENLPPALYVSVSDPSPEAETWVKLTARIIDPEADAIQSVAWRQTDGTNVGLETLTEYDPLLGNEAEAGFWTPTGPSSVIIAVSACDDRQACGETSVSVTTD